MPAFPKFSYVQIEQAAPCCYLGGDSVRGSFAVSREFRCDVLLSGLMSAQSCRSALACGRFIHFRRKAMDRCCLLWHMTQPGLWLLKGESRTVCDVDELLPPRFATRAASTVWYSRASGGQLPPFRFKQSTGSDRRGLAGGHRSPKLGRPVPGALGMPSSLPSTRRQTGASEGRPEPGRGTVKKRGIDWPAWQLQAPQFLGQRGSALLACYGTAESVATRADPELKWFQPQRRVGFSANVGFSWEYTKSAALVAPVINAAMYVIVVTFLITHPPPDAPAVDFGSLSSIVTAFQNPDGVFAGWLHYCVFDPLVGLGEVLDSQENKLPHALVATCLQRLAAQVPCLILTLLFGPMGFLLYLAVRTVTLASRPAASEA
ncbi:unnamed protein product [Symbiodinium sp. KB8]|nr:unnamed protein product [Symbiodinium sp. KB8]